MAELDDRTNLIPVGCYTRRFTCFEPRFDKIDFKGINRRSRGEFAKDQLALLNELEDSEEFLEARRRLPNVTSEIALSNCWFEPLTIGMKIDFFDVLPKKIKGESHACYLILTERGLRVARYEETWLGEWPPLSQRVSDRELNLHDIISGGLTAEVVKENLRRSIERLTAKG